MHLLNWFATVHCKKMKTVNSNYSAVIMPIVVGKNWCELHTHVESLVDVHSQFQ